MPQKLPALGAVLALLALAAPAGAQPEPPPPVVGEPEPATFDVYAGSADESTRGRGIIGGGGFYHGTITISPRYEIHQDGLVRIQLDPARVMLTEVARQDPGGLALLVWSFDLMALGNPAGLVREVTVEFDTGSATLPGTGGTYEVKMPPGATRLRAFDVHWVWNARNDHLVRFEAQGAGFPVGRAALLTGLAALGFYVARTRRKRRTRDEPTPAVVTGGIVSLDGTPRAGINVILHSPVQTRTCQTGAEGAYRFEDVPPGAYTLFVDADGYRHVCEELQVTP